MLAISSIEVRGFRNLEPQTLTLQPRFNVFAGENGQGKTNVLEAIYLATTSRSFRTSVMAECVRHEGDFAHVTVRVADDREPGAPDREQTVDIVGGRRRVRVDGKRPPTLAAFALATPVVLFEPASLQLSQGPAAERRKLLDRVALHLAARNGGGAAMLIDAERYRRAHQHRRRVLENGGDPRLAEPYEILMSDHGSRIVRSRADAADALRAPTLAAFAEIARTPLALEIAYAPRAPTDAAEFLHALVDRRATDARRGTATVGPHLDDLSLTLGGRPARQVASQGQHRALVLALKGAELAAIARSRDVQPILLLDDVSSELDPMRNAALFRFLHDRVGQVVLTTTRPEVIELHGERADFSVHRGGIVRSPPASNRG